MRFNFDKHSPRVLDLLGQGFSVRAISRETGISNTTLRKYLKLMEIPYIKPDKVLDQAFRAEVVDMYTSGWGISSIAKVSHVKCPRIKQILIEEGVVLRSLSDVARKRFNSTIDKNAFKDLSNPKVQYLLGFLIADGSISDSGQVVIVLNRKDKHILFEFMEILGMNRPPVDSDIFDKRTLKTYSRSALSFKCKEIADDLTNQNIFPRKSMKERLPNCSITRDFWRGIVDGDGCIYITKSTCCLALVGSLEITQGFLHFLENNFDFRTKRHPVKDKKNDLYKVQLTGDDARRAATLLYENCNISLNRKQILAERVWNVERYTKDKS